MGVRRVVGLALFPGLLLVSGCGEEPAAPVLVESPLLVSNALPATVIPGQSQRAVRVANEVVFVSLAPGNVPNGIRAVIENPRTGAWVTTVMREGGFDPVAVAANVGDTLDVGIERAGSTTPLHYSATVPPRRRPIVVRIDPPPGKRDVPLNATMYVVFSEPIDEGSLTAAGLQLRTGGTPVAGRLEFRDPDHVIAAFVPETDLARGTTYELEVTQAIRDLDGDPLETEIHSSFSTTDAPPEASPFGQIAFLSNRSSLSNVFHVYVINPDGSGLARLSRDRLGDGVPSWSPDGKRIVFPRGGDSYEDGGIYLMNTDGSGLTRLTGLTKGLRADYDPAWSPDGSHIAFARGISQSCGVDCVWAYSIHVMRADGSNITKLTSGFNDLLPAWSPDNQRIAFNRTTYLGGDNEFTQVFVMDADGTKVRPLTSGLGSAPSWSPDGLRIAFWSEEPKGLAIIDSGGTSPPTLIRPGGTDLVFGIPVGWSPDGHQLVVTGWDSVGAPNVTLFTLDLSSRHLRPLTSIPTGVSGVLDHYPAWSRVKP